MLFLCVGPRLDWNPGFALTNEEAATRPVAAIRSSYSEVSLTVSRQVWRILTSVSRNDGSVPALNQPGKLVDTPICFEVTASSDPSVLCGSRNPASQWLQLTLVRSYSPISCRVSFTRSLPWNRAILICSSRSDTVPGAEYGLCPSPVSLVVKRDGARLSSKLVRSLPRSRTS